MRREVRASGLQMTPSKCMRSANDYRKGWSPLPPLQLSVADAFVQNLNGLEIVPGETK
jgi:hypothetical protein